MDFEQMLLKQPTPFDEVEAARKIKRIGEGEELWTIILAIAYGVILGKGEERARRAGRRSENA